MNSLLPVGVGLLAISALTFLCATYHRPEIEADLTNRTTTALSGVVSVHGISAEGQIITLKGTVASEDIKAKAGAAAGKVYGVSSVRNLLEVAGASAPTMSAAFRKSAESCQAEFTSILKTRQIEFKSGSATISPASHHLLDMLAKAANQCPAVAFEVGGHTDARGLPESNVKLSQNRAGAVVTYLETKGVAADRMTPLGYGPKVPLAPNNTVQGRQLNRRTEFKVKGL